MPFFQYRSTRSPEAEEVLRRQDVRWRADGRCTQSIRRTLRVARPRSSLRIFLARCIPNKRISSPVSSCWRPAAESCELARSTYSPRTEKIDSRTELSFFYFNSSSRLARKRLPALSLSSRIPCSTILFMPKKASIPGRKKRTERKFPANTFQEAITLADAIQKYAAGQKVRRLTLFEKLDQSPRQQ